MKKILLLLGSFAAGVLALPAQQISGVCGVGAADAMLLTERLKENLKNRDKGVADRGAIQYVPVHFHLVGDNAGAGKVKESRVLDQLCALNAQYAPMDIRFYLSPHPTIGTLFDYTINNNNVYTNQTSWLTMHNKRHNKAINVYIVDVAASGSNTEGDALAYYNIPRDWIVAKKAEIKLTGNLTLPHEVGHFFSLLHTFNGWESNRFDSSDPTWPIAPAVSPDGVPTERANGSNCAVAGDYLCDTPSDYNLGLGFSGCEYNLGAKDPTGVLVDPMEKNMMGYFLECADHVFTEDQQDLILTDLASSGRNYLDNNFAPAATEINTPAEILTSPANAATTPYYDEVLLEWEPVDGATYYLVEVDLIFAYNSPSAQSHVVTSTSKLITGLLPNRTYYWRVRPFNEYVTCAAPRQRSFKTPLTSAVRDIEGLNALQVAPNPVGAGMATLFVSAERNFEADLQVFDVAGRRVYAQNGLFIANGESAIELPVEGLQNGLYVVMLQSGVGQTVRKFTVLRP